MGRKLASYVSVDGKSYGPSDEVPDDIAALITNPKAWQEPEPEPEKAQTRKPAAKP